jgi:hypothetical protein
VNRPHNPEVGWAVQVPPEELRRREARSEALRRLLTLRNLLFLILVLWNGLFLVFLLYAAAAQYSAHDAEIRILATLWIWSDLAILLVAGTIWSIRRGHGRAA